MMVKQIIFTHLKILSSAFESCLHMRIAPVRCGAKKIAPTTPTGIEQKFAPHRCDKNRTDATKNCTNHTGAKNQTGAVQ